ALAAGVDWAWFIVSQLVFGIVAATVVVNVGPGWPLRAGPLGGIVGGLLMPLPALLWGYLSGHGIWYPVHLLAAMVHPALRTLPADQLGQLQEFHADWFWTAVAIHAAFSIGFGIIYGLLLERLPEVPSPMTWGGAIMPLMWTGAGYGMMGVLNPVLQQY